MSIFERELSLLSRAPSSHWLIERARWGPLVSLWSLEGFASNIVRQVFGIWSPRLGNPAGIPRVGVPSRRVPGVPRLGVPRPGGHRLTWSLYHNSIVMILDHLKTSYSKYREFALMD